MTSTKFDGPQMVGGIKHQTDWLGSASQVWVSAY